MRCPFCDAENIQGVDACASCGADLAGLDLPEAQRGFSGRLLGDRIGDLKLSSPIVVAPDTPVAEAVARMRQKRHGCVFVERHGEPIGLFNERHLLTRVLRAGLDPATTPVAEVMSSGLTCLGPEDPPAFAVHCMVSRGFRHLPVVSDGALVGFLSVRTILAYVNDELIGA